MLQSNMTDKTEFDHVVPLVKLWNKNHNSSECIHICEAKTSECGKFIAIRRNTDICFVHLEHDYEEIIPATVKEFSWSSFDWKHNNCITIHVDICLLLSVDFDFNLTVYRIGKHGNSFRSSLLTIFACSLFKDIEGIDVISAVSLISVWHNANVDLRVICLVNHCYLVKVSVCLHRQPSITETLVVGKPEKNVVKRHVSRDFEIFMLKEDNSLIVVDTSVEFSVKATINLPDTLNISSVLKFNISNNRTLVLVDEEHILYVQPISLTTSSRTPTQERFYGAWRNRKKTSSSVMSEENRSITQTKRIPLPHWTKDLSLTDLHISGNVVFIQFKVQCSTYLVQYNRTTEHFSTLDVTQDLCVCFDDMGLQPVLYVSVTRITLPMFDVSQEQLVDKIIQFADIPTAEKICKTNDWDQFSIPMHTLEVGLHHNQLDVIRFFLKNRERVFSRYWKNFVEMSLNPLKPSSSYSLRHSDSIEPEEMTSAIEMLMATIESSAKKKRKQDFFRKLLNLTLAYLSALIQDACHARNMKRDIVNDEVILSKNYQRKSSSQSLKTTDFLYDLDETLVYLTEKLALLRGYLKQTPSSRTSQHTELEASEATQLNHSATEEYLLAGRIATLQQCLLEQQDAKGGWSCLVELGMNFVLEKLKSHQVNDAEIIMYNMGLQPNIELKAHYLRTVDCTLRDLLYTVLEEKNLIDETDLEDRRFLKQLQKCYSNRLQGVMFSLEQVRCWLDETRKKIIFDGIFLTDAIATIHDHEGNELWDYLIQHNLIEKVSSWLSGENIPSNQTLPSCICLDFNIDSLPDHIEAKLLDVLTIHGYYPQCYVNDLPKLCKLLVRNGLLFDTMHPMELYKRRISEIDRSRLVESFNIHFVEMCARENLMLLLWYFLDAYNLSEDCIQLPSPFKTWVDFMFCIKNYIKTQDDSIEGVLNSYKDVVPMEDQGILAVAISLVARRPLDKMLADPSFETAYGMEKQLLTDSLHLYPKIANALLKSNTSDGSKNDDDVTMYQLLKSNTELDSSKWFTWQLNNKLAIKEEGSLLKLPHFSHPQLVDSFSQNITLTYDCYLKQGRPMFAYLVYQRDIQQHYASTETVAEVAYKIALENFDDLSIPPSCCSFLQLLNVDCETVQVDARVAQWLYKYSNKKSIEKRLTLEELKMYIVNLFVGNKAIKETVKLLEDSTELHINENHVQRFSFEAVCHWQLAVRFCRSHKLPVVTRFMQMCCKTGNWLHFILFIHFYQVPSNEAISVLSLHMKNMTLKDHLIAIIESTSVLLSKKREKDLAKQSKAIEIKSSKKVRRDIRAQFYSRLGAKVAHEQQLSSIKKENKEKNKGKMSTEPLLEITYVHDNILDILLECDKSTEPSAKLLQYGVHTFHPLLPVLSACYKGANLIGCLCVWYLSNLATKDRDEMVAKISTLSNHLWQESDLGTIMKLIYKKGFKYGNLVSQGLNIFLQDHLLTHFLQFVEAVFERKPTEDLVHLLSRFYSEHLLPHKHLVLTLLFCEEITYDCLMLIVKQCSSQHDVCLLLRVITEAKFGTGFSISVPDFMLLRKTVEIIYNANIPYKCQQLFTTNSFATETKNIFSILLQHSAFDDAIMFAELHDLPSSEIAVCEINDELKSFKDLWHDREKRYLFWKKADATLSKKKCEPCVAANFFETHASNVHYPFEERSLLLLFAIKWYSCNRSDNAKLTGLEKMMWEYKMKVFIETERDVMEMFDRELLEFLTFEHDCDIEDSLTSRQYETGTLHYFDDKEELAFRRLVNCLLDSDYISEALRVAHLFNHTTRDLDIVMTCTQLAKEEKKVEAVSDSVKAILAATTTRHISVSGILERSGSFTRLESCSSTCTSTMTSCDMHDFVFIEEVQSALEKLTLRVNHGKKSCQRDLITFKVAKIFQMSHTDVIQEDHFTTLRRLADSGLDKRRQLSKQFIKAFNLPSEEVVRFVADIMIYLLRICSGEEAAFESTFLVSEWHLPTFDDIVSLLQLTSNSASVGSLILQEAGTLLDVLDGNLEANWAYIVDLLIYAHHCFTISCDMEGIAGVLQAARILTKPLAHHDQYSLLVHMLTGIGRFKEMFYVIEMLYNNLHFEVLCRRGIVNESRLKQALTDFMKRYHPDDRDSFNMILLGFGMYREYAQQLHQDGSQQINKVKAKLFQMPAKEMSAELKSISQTFSYAAENFKRDDCLIQAQTCIRLSRLVLLQIELLPLTTCVLELSLSQVKEFLSLHHNAFEAFLVADCYALHDSWAEPIYEIVVKQGDFVYLQKMLCFVQLHGALLTEVATRVRAEKNPTCLANMRKLMSYVRDVKIKQKIFRELAYVDLETELNEGPAGPFIRDQLF